MNYSRILTIKNAKFLGYYFYINLNIKGDFQICISAPLSSYLVRAKLYPVERTIGSFKCTKKRCEVCENVNITDSFTSLVTQNTYKINHKVNCDDKCLIYLLTCKQC